MKTTVILAFLMIMLFPIPTLATENNEICYWWFPWTCGQPTNSGGGAGGTWTGGVCQPGDTTPTQELYCFKPTCQNPGTMSCESYCNNNGQWVSYCSACLCS